MVLKSNISIWASLSVTKDIMQAIESHFPLP